VLYRQAGPQDEPLVSVPFTTLRGSEISPAFSPNGRRAAFAWNGGPTHRFQICVQAIGSNRLTQITNGESDFYIPAWSLALTPTFLSDPAGQLYLAQDLVVMLRGFWREHPDFTDAETTTVKRAGAGSALGTH
jgi:hypothetical protein